MSNNMVFTKDIIMKLKDVREEKGLSLNDIMNLIEANGEFVSKTTLSRVFADGSEEIKFRYEDTIRPIANALLDIEEIEEGDNIDTKAMKSLLQYKKKYIEDLENRIEELEIALDKEKIKSHEKMDEARAQWSKTIDFLKEQISLKDKRMDLLLEAVMTKDSMHRDMLNSVLTCPCRKDVDE